MITANELTKTYLTKKKKGFLRREIKKTEAVKRLSLTIKPGQIIGLLGINGAGKTTTIKMLSTLLEPDGGSCTIDNMDLVKDAYKIKQIVNMIAGGERMIYWRLSARENLQYFAKIYNLDDTVMKERIKELLDFIDLGEKADEPVERYSKGMKQRLQIARGLINDPKYIFMDEPTLGLDAPIAREIRKKVSKLAKQDGKGILLTSHYIKEIEELCDYVYIINKGEKIMEGTPKDITNIVKSTYRYNTKLINIDSDIEEKIKHFMRDNDWQYDIKNLSEEYEVEVAATSDVQGELITFLSSVANIKSFSSVEPSLEEAIIKLSEDARK